jgi:hypothetical protein
MGGHNPYGFRARDVLKTEKLDLRQLAHFLVLVDERKEERERRARTHAHTHGEEEEEEEEEEEVLGLCECVIEETEEAHIKTQTHTLKQKAKEAEAEYKRHEQVVSKTMKKLESLRGIMPMATLSPAVVYVGEVEEEMHMDITQGFYAMSSSPPRR